MIIMAYQAILRIIHQPISFHERQIVDDTKQFGDNHSFTLCCMRQTVWRFITHIEPLKMYSVSCVNFCF